VICSSAGFSLIHSSTAGQRILPIPNQNKINKVNCLL